MTDIFRHVEIQGVLMDHFEGVGGVGQGHVEVHLINNSSQLSDEEKQNKI